MAKRKKKINVGSICVIVPGKNGFIESMDKDRYDSLRTLRASNEHRGKREWSWTYGNGRYMWKKTVIVLVLGKEAMYKKVVSVTKPLSKSKTIWFAVYKCRLINPTKGHEGINLWISGQFLKLL
jgi:hypothetical protein